MASRMVTEPELRAALPHVARTGLPLLVHAELPGPVDEATRRSARCGLERVLDLSAIAAGGSRALGDPVAAVAYAGSTSSGCTLSTSRLARRWRSCVLRGRRGFRSAWKLVHTICISARKKSRTGQHCASARRRSAARENRDKLWQGLREGHRSGRDRSLALSTCDEAAG